MDTLFRDTIFLDTENGSASRGDVMVRDGVISSTGRFPGNVPEDCEVFEGRGSVLVMPGFVNSHTHAAMVLLRGFGEELPLREWLEKRIWPVEAGLTPEHVYWGSRGAILEMASTGTTCFADMYFEMDEVARAADESGMRCSLCRGIVGDDEKKILEGIDLYRKWDRKGLTRVFLGPHAPYTVPMETMRRLTAEGNSLGTGVHTHFLETEWEISYIRETFGLSPFSYLESSGLLGTPKTILAHGVWIEKEDLPLLEKSSVTIAHNPASNMKLGSGFAPLPSMLSSGVCVSLGTDGAASNNRLDMWGEMRLCTLIHKGQSKDPTVVTAKEVLRMATLEGARAAGFDDVGLIREGWQADLVVVDLDSPQFQGWDMENIAGFLVYAGSSRDIIGTMVAGKWLYRRDRPDHEGQEETMKQMARCRIELARAAGIVA
ncbi:MAG TPA: amidohydrolase [Synergistales bacterium]|nr:amidohydrolase [Synergistales bacterium]HRV71395.1 amidohydrolase [Thermovirgaceae bacterium]